MNKTHVRYMAAAAAFGFAAMSYTAQSGATGLDLGGIVGGTLGSLGGSYGGTSGGVSARADASIGYGGVDSKAKASIGSINAKAHVRLYKKKLNAHAKLFVGTQGYHKHGKLVAVKAVIGSKPLDAKAKLLLGKHTKAKVFASLGGKTKVTGKLVTAGTNADVRFGLNLLGNNPGGTNGTPPSGSTPGGSTPVAMASSFRELSNHDQYIMTKKCSTVLVQPYRFDDDMVALCRIIATL